MRAAASTITQSGSTSSRRCCAAALPPPRPARSPAATTCGSSAPPSAESGGPMLHVLIAEGTPARWQAERAGFGIPSNFSLLAGAARLHCPDIRCTPLNIADGEALPFGATLADFDAVMIPGSPLHVYDPEPAVTRQIEFTRAAFAAGVPVWGSCWGLQVATVALG